MRFIETIKIKEKKIINIDYHIKRAEKSIYDHYKIKFNFEKIISEINKEIILTSNEIYKLRIVYDNKDYNWELEKYTLKPVTNLKIVNVKDFFYRYKYLDRTRLDYLYSQRGNCDNIIISVNNYITDSYYANLVFEKDKEYFTPSTYLLNGTKRKFYLDNKIIKEREINIKDLKHFDKIHLINAMIDIGVAFVVINEFSLCIE